MAKKKTSIRKKAPVRKKAKPSKGTVRPKKKLPRKKTPHKKTPARKTKKAAARTSKKVPTKKGKKLATPRKSSAADRHLKQAVQRLFDEAAQGQVDLLVTITSQEKPGCWVQLKWDMVNLPYPFAKEPLAHFESERIEMSPDWQLLAWEPLQYVTIEHGSPPVEPIAKFVKAYFERILKVDWKDSNFDYREELA